jgi:hypothetical protein
MLPAKFGSIWPSSFRGEDFFNISQSETRIKHNIMHICHNVVIGIINEPCILHQYFVFYLRRCCIRQAKGVVGAGMNCRALKHMLISIYPDETHVNQYLPLMKHMLISFYPWWNTFYSPTKECYLPYFVL